jgi:ABC-type multidrug transport system permease subunit
VYVCLPCAGCFWYFWIVVMLCSLCALFFCQLLSVALPNSATAVAVFPATLFLFIAFAGFIVQLPQLPPWLGSWAPNVSFARWAFQGLVINEFYNNPRVSYASLATIEYTPDPYQTFVEGLGFQGTDKWFSVPILVLNMVVFRMLTYYTLVYVNYEKR